MAFVYDMGNLKKCGSGSRNFWVAKAFALLYSYTVEKSKDGQEDGSIF